MNDHCWHELPPKNHVPGVAYAVTEDWPGYKYLFCCHCGTVKYVYYKERHGQYAPKTVYPELPVK